MDDEGIPNVTVLSQPKMEELKLVTLPGVRVPAKLLLQRSLEKADHIKAVAVIIQWKNDTFDADWSTMKISDLVLMSKVLEKVANDEFFDKANSDK